MTSEIRHSHKRRLDAPTMAIEARVERRSPTTR